MVLEGKNPPDGVAFGFGLRCRGRHSPLRGCSARSSSPKAKIHGRSITHNFQTGSDAKLEGFKKASLKGNSRPITQAYD
jgi:hypothetical protein